MFARDGGAQRALGEEVAGSASLVSEQSTLRVARSQKASNLGSRLRTGLALGECTVCYAGRGAGAKRSTTARHSGLYHSD